MHALTTAAVLALAASAQAQYAMTYSIALSTPGPVANGALVQGAVHCSWVRPDGLGYAGGAFRLRMDGLGVADVFTPSNTNGGINSETTAQRVGVRFPSPIPPPYGTVSDSWTSGRRPKRAYLADETDPGSVQSGGGFRFPPMGSGPTDMHYSVEQQSGITYLTGRNGAGVENRIEHAQLPRALQGDPLFFEPSTDFDLFKFQVRAPLTGSGAATITPEILSSSIFTSETGAQVILTVNQIQALGASFTYTPAPAAALPLLLAAWATPRLRRRPDPPPRPVHA
jgi:hypothetical protein